MASSLRSRRANRISQDRPMSPPMSPTLSISPPSSRQSTEQIWDEGVQRIVIREGHRNRRLLSPPTSPQVHNDRCSDATLLDVISVYHHDNSPGGPGTTPPTLANEFHPRSPRNRFRFSFSPPLDTDDSAKQRADSAVSVSNPPTIPLPALPATARPLQNSTPANESSTKASPTSFTPSVESALSQIPYRPRLLSTPSHPGHQYLPYDSTSIPRSTGASLDLYPTASVSRSSSRLSNHPPPSDDGSPSPHRRLRPTPIRRHTSSSVSRRPAQLSTMPPRYVDNRKYSFAQHSNMPLPMPALSIDTSPVTTPPPSRHGSIPLSGFVVGEQARGRTKLTIDTAVGMGDQEVRSAFDDDDDDDEGNADVWWRVGAKSRRGSRERKDSVPVSPLQSTVEREAGVGEERGRRRTGSKAKGSGWKWGCFGGGD